MLSMNCHRAASTTNECFHKNGGEFLFSVSSLLLGGGDGLFYTVGRKVKLNLSIFKYFNIKFQKLKFEEFSFIFAPQCKRSWSKKLPFYYQKSVEVCIKVRPPWNSNSFWIRGQNETHDFPLFVRVHLDHLVPCRERSSHSKFESIYMYKLNLEWYKQKWSDRKASHDLIARLNMSLYRI